RRVGRQASGDTQGNSAKTFSGRAHVGAQECRLCANVERKPASGKGTGVAALFHGGEQRGPVRGRVQRRHQDAQRCSRGDTYGLGVYSSKRNRRTSGKNSPASDILSGQFRRKRRLDVLWRRSSRSLQTRCRFHRKNSEWSQASGPSGRTAQEV